MEMKRRKNATAVAQDINNECLHLGVDIVEE